MVQPPLPGPYPWPMARSTSRTAPCDGCGRDVATPALGASGRAVCPACGASQGAGPAPDDTAALQRFYTAAPPRRRSGAFGLVERLRDLLHRH